MSLFGAAVAQVAKDVGDEDVIAVNDRNTADYCKIFSLVARKQHFWHSPWGSKFEYVPTEISLMDILEEPLTDVQNLTTKSVLFKNYESTPSFKRNGKVGGKLAEEFHIEASASKTLQVEMKLGNITKKEVLWEKLYEKVNGKKIKEDHPLVKMIRSSKKKKLFLIGMIIYSGEDEVINMNEETTGLADTGAAVKPTVALNLNASASEDEKRHTTFAIPSEICLCYSCDEITIDKNGLLMLQLDDDIRN